MPLRGYQAYSRISSGLQRPISGDARGGLILYDGFYYYAGRDWQTGLSSFCRINATTYAFQNLYQNSNSVQFLYDTPNYFYFGNYVQTGSLQSHIKIRKSNLQVVRTQTVNNSAGTQLFITTGDTNDDETTYVIFGNYLAANSTSLQVFNSTNSSIALVNFRTVNIGYTSQSMLTQDSEFIYVSTNSGRVKIAKSNYAIVANTLLTTSGLFAEAFQEENFIYEVIGGNIRKVHKSNLINFSVTPVVTSNGSNKEAAKPYFENGNIIFFARGDVSSSEPRAAPLIFQIYNTATNTIQATHVGQFDWITNNTVYLEFEANRGLPALSRNQNGELIYMFPTFGQNVGKITPIFNPYIINT
jgi:cyclophilin family peptidyl-prolyl cis-trans isomerase